MNDLGIHPVVSRVLIKVDKLEEKTAGGIILAQSETRDREQEAHDKATVVENGPDAFVHWKEGKGPEPGDRVIYPSYAGIKVTKGDDIYRLIMDDDIVALIEEEKKNA